MAKTVYDMVKLEALGDVDVGHAVGCSGSYQAYFDKLDSFVEMPKEFFRDYNPTVVVYDEDTRGTFLGEVALLKEEYSAMGLKTIVAALEDLELAIEKSSAGSLSDWILGLEAKTEQMAKRLETARISLPGASGGQKAEKPKIVAVDDKPELLTALVNMLKDDYTVMAATSGPAALKIIEKHSPKLFLLDIEMPEMDGYQLAKHIKERGQFADVPIIFLTGKNSRDAVLAAIMNGGNDYLLKPVDRDLLLDKIKKYTGT